MPVKIIIIEDEPATARNLQFLLQETDPAIKVIATLTSVAEAVKYLGSDVQYDLIFSDIHLSDGLSFEIFSEVVIKKPVIFVTAYNEYALRAFKTNGIDYILKPFDEQEIARAYQKYKLLSQPKVPVYPDLGALTEMLQRSTSSYRQSFLVHFREKLLPIAVKDIAWIYTANELVYFKTTDNKQYNLEFTLEQLQQQLDPAIFFRANRQFIVQRSCVKEVDFYFNGRLLLKLLPDTPEKVLVSKARVPEFKAWMDR